MLRAAIVVLVLLAADTDAGPSGFDVYRGSRELCSERVYGNSNGKRVHISWTSHATKDDLATVVAFYEKATGTKAGTGPKGERTFQAPKNVHLNIYPASKNSDFPSCAKKPSAGENTVIMISQMMG